MKTTLLKAALLVTIGALWLPGSFAIAQDGTGEFPILALNCQTDPGGVNPSGGRVYEPGELENDYGCVPAAGIGVTVYSFELRFQARCDTDEEGRCSVDAPRDPEKKLSVAVHTAMLEPGYEPRDVIAETANYTEYAGVGLVNLPSSASTPEATVDRQILTLNISGCGTGPCSAGDVLAQVSPGDITSEGMAWLGPDDTGIVTFDIGSLQSQSDTVDIMFTTDGQPDIVCTHAANGETVEAEWIDEVEGVFYRITPISPSGVNCDVALAS